MKPVLALGLAVFALVGWVAPVPAQTTPVPVPAETPPPDLPTPDFSAPPTTDPGEIWKGTNRDYHFYANVGLSYMWLHGGSPFSSGPLTGPNFSTGVFNNAGWGAELKGSELYQSTTGRSTWEMPHKP